MKQWGVYADYGYTPNPDLKGWSNDHPFPPEIEVDSPYLTRRQAQARRADRRRSPTGAARMLADARRATRSRRVGPPSSAFLGGTRTAGRRRARSVEDPTADRRRRRASSPAGRSAASCLDRASVEGEARPTRRSRRLSPDAGMAGRDPPRAAAPRRDTGARSPAAARERDGPALVRDSLKSRATRRAAGVLPRRRRPEGRPLRQRLRDPRRPGRLEDVEPATPRRRRRRSTCSRRRVPARRGGPAHRRGQPTTASAASGSPVSPFASTRGTGRCVTPDAAEGIAPAARARLKSRPRSPAAYLLGTGWDRRASPNRSALHAERARMPRRQGARRWSRRPSQPLVTRVLPRGNWQDESGAMVAARRPRIPPAAAERAGTAGSPGSTWPSWIIVAGEPAHGPRLRRTGSGSSSSARASAASSRTSGRRASGRAIPNCSTGWPSSSARAAGTSSTWSS